jgi:hypothetical protein
MRRREHPLPFARHAGGIQLHLHQLIHVLQCEHVAVQLHHALILRQAEGRQLAPAVVEARVVAVVDVDLGEEVGDLLGGDAAAGEGGEAFGREGFGVEGDEGVFRPHGFEGVVEGEEAGEVVGVGDEGCPDCTMGVSDVRIRTIGRVLPFLESVTLSWVAIVSKISYACLCVEL